LSAPKRGTLPRTFASSRARTARLVRHQAVGGHWRALFTEERGAAIASKVFRPRADPSVAGRLSRTRCHRPWSAAEHSAAVPDGPEADAQRQPTGWPAGKSGPNRYRLEVGARSAARASRFNTKRARPNHGTFEFGPYRGGEPMHGAMGSWRHRLSLGGVAVGRLGGGGPSLGVLLRVGASRAAPLQRPRRKTRRERRGGRYRDAVVSQLASTAALGRRISAGSA